MSDMTDSERLARVLRERFPNVPPPSDDIWLATPAVKVIDCVLSLNRHYDRFVLPRVKRFEAKHPSITSLGDLRGMIDQYHDPVEFSRTELVYEDSRRAATLVGVLEYLLEVEAHYSAPTEEERLQAWANEARPGDFLAVGVRGFGLAGFQYLRMLFGAQSTKPDVHVIRFVSTAVGRRVTDVQALYLLERAAKLAGLPLRDVDVAIWQQGAI